GYGPCLREAPQAVVADSGRGAGAPWPPDPRPRGTRAPARRECSDDRPVARATTCDRWWTTTSAASSVGCVAEDSDPYLRRLEGARARLSRDRPRRPLRRQYRRELRAYAGAHRRSKWLDRVHRSPGSRERTGRGCARPPPDFDAVPAARHR